MGFSNFPNNPMNGFLILYNISFKNPIGQAQPQNALPNISKSMPKNPKRNSRRVMPPGSMNPCCRVPKGQPAQAPGLATQKKYG